MEASDDELMARVAQRDQAAFSRLSSRHLASIHRYLVRLTGSRADADELSQETFLRVWQRADGYRAGTVRFSTWLHRVAHNLAVDELRRRRGESLDADDEAAQGYIDPAAGPEQQHARARASERLEQAVRALPATQRAALMLCQVQGFSNQEAAEIMGMGIRAIESLIARARRSLREQLSEPDAATDTGTRR